MKKVTKAVIPCAGLGTRFLPITKSVAKEVLPIVDKPTIAYIIDECVSSGITDILIITNPYKKIIEDYFDINYELEKRLQEKNKTAELELLKTKKDNVNIYFLRQGEPLGSGHAVNLAKKFIGDEPFAVLYGDDLMKSEQPAIGQLIKVYEQNDCNVIGCLEVDKSVVDRYGIIKLKDNTEDIAEKLVEKPTIEDAPSNLAGLGRYILKPEIFDALDTVPKHENGEYYLTDGMEILMKNGDFRVCNINAKYYDTGNKIGYIKANMDYALERNELRDELQEYINNLNKN